MANAKNGGKKPAEQVAPKTEQPAPVVNDEPKQDAPPAPPAPDAPKPKTNDEILAELVAAQIKAAQDYALSVVNDEIEQSEKDKAVMVSFKANDAVKQFKQKLAAEKVQKELDEKLNEHLKIISNYAAAVINEQNLLKSLPDADKRSDDEKAQLQAVYDVKKSIEDKLTSELTTSFKATVSTVIHLPAGMTGKQLTKVVTGGDNGEKIGKQDVYENEMAAGLTNEQIMSKYPESIDAKGGANGTLRTARTAFNKKQAAKQ